jgi:hypothetical protein
MKDSTEPLYRLHDHIQLIGIADGLLAGALVGNRHRHIFLPLKKLGREAELPECAYRDRTIRQRQRNSLPSHPITILVCARLAVQQNVWIGVIKVVYNPATYNKQTFRRSTVGVRREREQKDKGLH